MDFVAIDFETACSNANSACQLAVVEVVDSLIVAEHCWLIRPPRMYFSRRNIEIHGISPAQVSDAATMEELWQQVEPLVDGRVIVAHNARFDIGVLTASLAAYDVACPQLEFTCTRALARAAWPGRARYGLKPLGTSLGIEFRHHDALEDARCCAKIALAVASDLQQTELTELEKTLRLTRGNFHQGIIKGPRMIGRRRQDAASGPRSTTDRWGFPAKQPRKAAGVDPVDVLRAAADSLPLSGKNIVLLGALRGLTVAQSQDLVQELGGNCQASISKDTHYVIACGTSLESASDIVSKSLAASLESTTAAAEANVSGIRLLSERQFRALLPGGKSSAWR